MSGWYRGVESFADRHPWLFAALSALLLSVLCRRALRCRPPPDSGDRHAGVAVGPGLVCAERTGRAGKATSAPLCPLIIPSPRPEPSAYSPSAGDQRADLRPSERVTVREGAVILQHLGARSGLQLDGVERHRKHAVVADRARQLDEQRVAESLPQRLYRRVVNAVIADQALGEIDDLGIFKRECPRSSWRGRRRSSIQEYPACGRRPTARPRRTDSRTRARSSVRPDS